MRALIVVAIVCITAAAHATPTQDLDRARKSFRDKHYQSAIPVLNTLLYPDLQLARQEEAIEAQLMLGAAYYETGERDRAIREFEKVIQLEPDRSITTLFYSEGAVRLFEETKRTVQERMERDAQKKKLAEELERIRKYRESLIVVESRPYYVNFLPFGAGQFQNKQRTKGVLFATGQGLTLGASAGIFLYLAGTYGLVAKVPLDDGPRVRLLQQIEIGTGVAFLGIYAFGVVDALINYQPHARIQGADDLIEDLAPSPPKKKTALRDRLRLGPMITPTGVGIGLSLEND